MSSTYAAKSLQAANIKNQATQSRTAEENTPTVKYKDCLLGKVGIPREHNQKIWFQLMSIMSMVPITVTLHWIINTSWFTWESFEQQLPMYPLTIAIVIAVRFFIANPVVDGIVKTFISPHFSGLKKSLSITWINIIFMGALVALIKAMITLGGLAGFSWENYIGSLPLSFLISFVVGYFFISPAMKKVWAAGSAHRNDFSLPRPHLNFYFEDPQTTRFILAK